MAVPASLRDGCGTIQRQHQYRTTRAPMGVRATIVPPMIALFFIALLAATVNGAIGFGISTISVPLALLIVSSRELNPALVAVEVVLSAYLLWLNRSGLRRAWPHVRYVLVALVPGIAIGTALLARLDVTALKLATFVVLLPLILLQLSGVRRAFDRRLRAGSLLLGAGVGALYAATTVSGPPLATFYNNQGLTHHEFRAALAAIKLAAAVLAAAAYAAVGLHTSADFTLVLPFLAALAIGVPLGGALSRWFGAEAFRRACMGFAAAAVAFGASALLRSQGRVPRAVAFAPFVLTLVAGPVAFAHAARRDLRAARVGQERP